MSVLHALSCVALLGLSACTELSDDRCGPESRDVTADARMLTAQGDSMGYALVTLVESRSELIGRAASWYVASGLLVGHLQAARLVASEDRSRLLLSLPGGSADPDIILQGEVRPYAGPVDFNELFLRATNGGVTMVLETDLASFELIALPLQVATFNDWGQAHCS